MSRSEILEKLKRSIAETDSDLAAEAANEAVAAGIEPTVAVNDGLSKGMKVIGDLFDEGEVFVPQLLLAAEAFETAMGIIFGEMSEEEKSSASQGKVLIHTVQGDIHDIGKNIVKTMMSAAGFEVIDLGRDVAVEEVIKQAKQHKVDIIAGSALMTTTMPAQRDIVSLLKEEGIRDQFKIMFGGAPVSAEWVTKIGADAYADTASGAVEQALALMAEKRSG
ncbi:methyltransferase cognate corrinoid protein [Desulfofarcimen acetoxidans DSM 771]|uniref:Methyltransferase cognate corrinoid protein n=1 Tax=Desulfofarcimen acetoxidans (strain ATCC 49208 / DSM 771 / KCTC 5769 / VKM B-1644 / 5575) TaxID=485916 RepID=C8VVB9_DESAS|nr:B12-binding domain-containing protein [Desulfofarcimen acetoxidans]ACV60988.1 methyltransferase cognate corrinoid protein [Desulfofarcimen acetoxidans DSM 771]